MAIDLLLHLDDDTHQAHLRCMSVEEWLREMLMTGAGLSYGPPPAGYDAVMRPMVSLDLRA